MYSLNVLVVFPIEVGLLNIFCLQFSAHHVFILVFSSLGGVLTFDGTGGRRVATWTKRG